MPVLPEQLCEPKEPHQPKKFQFPKKRYGSQNRAFQPTWFDNFPWLHYDENTDTVLCFTCHKQYAKGNLKTANKKDLAFIKEGFANWKKAIEKFRDHQMSECHKTSIDYEVNLPQNYGNVHEMLNVEAKKTMQLNRLCLVKVIESLQYLCRQGQAIQGDTDFASNFIQL